MAQQPTFSIVMPTKNRSHLIRDAIRSVLWQTYADFELVIIDNDDTDATHKVIETFDDPRIRYVRTGGLSMPDNWAAAVREARGEYINIMADKHVFYPNTLVRALHHIEKTQTEVLTCERGMFLASSGENYIYENPKISSRTEWIPSEFLFETFITHGYWQPGLGLLLPRGYNSFTHRNVIEKIERSSVSNPCPPAIPDYNYAFLQLAFVEKTWHTYESFFVTNNIQSNGKNVIRKEAGASQFIKEIGEDLFYDQVPIKTSTLITSMVYNDFIRLQKALPEKLGRWNVSLLAYYTNTYIEILDRQLKYGNTASDLSDFEMALSQESEALQQEVQAKISVHRHLRAWQTLKEDYQKSKSSGQTSQPTHYENIIEAVIAQQR